LLLQFSTGSPPGQGFQQDFQAAMLYSGYDRSQRAVVPVVVFAMWRRPARRPARGQQRLAQMPVIDEFEQHCAAAAALYRGSSVRRSQPARVQHRLPTLRSRQRAGSAQHDKLHGAGALVRARSPQHRQHQLLVVGSGEQATRHCAWGAQPFEQSFKQVINKSLGGGRGRGEWQQSRRGVGKGRQHCTHAYDANTVEFNASETQMEA
jgi:hypothetical protein